MLPEAFVKRIGEQLGPEEAQEFLACYEEEAQRGLRVNGLKGGGGAQGSAAAEAVTLAHIDALPPIMRSWQLEPIPWSAHGFYYDADAAPGRHPYHHAGVYYIQEPSAQAVAEKLDVRPDMRVLDLCAAPGGKTTQLAAAMQGEGLLVANEPYASRAKILSENIERMGVANCLVTSHMPAELRQRFGCNFHRILVDAPCSGEGMFRKDEAARAEWSPENVLMCAERQSEILDEAYQMLLPGGRLVYSTCTFSPQENEEGVENFLARHEDMRLIEQERLWPHKVRGEGHFVAVLEKRGAEDCFEGEAQLETSRDRFAISTIIPTYSIQKGLSYKQCKEFAVFAAESLSAEFTATLQDSSFHLFGDQLYLLPTHCPSLAGLKVLRPGLHLGTIKKNRFEPAHALSHALPLTAETASVNNFISLAPTDPRVISYLSGQTISANLPNGWCLVAVDGFALGWGKAVNGVVKNHYPKGLRVMGV